MEGTGIFEAEDNKTELFLLKMRRDRMILIRQENIEAQFRTRLDDLLVVLRCSGIHMSSNLPME